MFGRASQTVEKELSTRSLNYSASILDEIALEGLDGLTLQGLWVRLHACPYFPMVIDPNSQKFIWEIVKRLENVAMYELPSERSPLIIFNRFECVDPELGNVIEPEVIPEDIYSHKLVDDSARAIYGSCSTYNTRKEITRSARQTSLEEATFRWGGRLVLVANQSVRSAALMGDDVDPSLELNAMQYCILERIGRSRYHGEVTQGKMSLQCMGEEPKSLFYYRKTLQLHKLISKQAFHLKSQTQNASGSMLHLPRFFREHKPKEYYLTEKVVEMLKTRPNLMADYDEVRQELGLHNVMKKLFKSPDFQRFIKTDLKIPYRQLHPDAPVQQWKHKGSDKEKILRVVQLINPNASVKDEWTKEEDVEEEEEGNGYLDVSTQILDQPLMTQAFNAVDGAGQNGLTQMELAKVLGQTKLQSRTLCRNLLRKGLVSTYMNDVGRQRVSRFCSKRFDQSGHLSQQFHRERDKMLSLVKNKRKSDVAGKEPVTKKRKTPVESELPVAPVETSTDQSAENHSYPEPCTAFVKVEPPDYLEREYECDESDLLAEQCSTFGLDSSNQNVSEAETSTGKGNASSKKPARDKAASKGLPRKKKKTVKSAPDVVWRREADSDQVEEGATEILFAEDVSLVETSKKNSSFTEDLKDMYSKPKKDGTSFTTRVLKRANLIIEAVQQHQVIDGVTKLLKLIHEEEEKEGLNLKIDKKSLLRLLEKLGKDGHIKNIKVLLKGPLKEKHITFICEPNTTIENSVIQSALEQAKMKLCIPTSDRFNQIMMDNAEHSNASDAFGVPAVSFSGDSIHQSIREMHALEGSPTKKPNNAKTFKRNAKYGRKYGYQPKFVRMRTMHQLLFYLVHDYGGDCNLNQDVTIDKFNNITPISNDLILEMSQIYFSAIDWRMFIPPLPKHVGWPNGWTMICDVLLRLPLSIFVNIVNINFEVCGLEEYLSHPIRKHYLVKQLPSNIRSQLTVARRYIFNCHETVSRLCYIGLVQFGPQRLKEKDQVFIFMNKHSSLLDTTTSPPGYHQVDTELEYKVLRYDFNTCQDVDHYWYDMWSICVNTALGGRMCVSGKDILLEVLENKPAMIAAIHPRTPEDALVQDNGDVPGDHCGAAGLDSAMFAHLKKNWNWANNQEGSSNPPKNDSHSAVVNDHLPQTENGLKCNPSPKASRYLRQPTNETLSPVSLKAKDAVERSTPNALVSSTPVHATATRKKPSKRQDRLRTVPMPRAPRRKPYYDAADMEALTLMSKLRVEWCAPEDNILLLCKVAASYLSPNPRQHLVSMQAWRDFLHRNIDSSRNKTSRAVQRRILYMMKNPSTARSVSLCLDEIKQDPKINEQFSNWRNQLNQDPDISLEEKMSEKFVELVTILQGRYQNMRSRASPLQKMLVPDSLHEFRQRFTICSPSQTMRVKGRFQTVKNVGDVHAAVINSMIYSSLCCLNDKTSYAYQLFEVYQQYPDDLLRATMSKIRGDQMISLRKAYARTKVRAGNVLPVSNCPYQLSISYLHLLQTRYQYEIFQESFMMLQKLAWDMLMNTDVDGLEFLAYDGGSTAAFIEFLIKDKVSFQITIPDQLIILDPRISQKDETYARLVARYQDILRNCKETRENASEPIRDPFIDILPRDEMWETGVQTERELEPSKNKKRKTDPSLSSKPSTSEDSQTAEETRRTSTEVDDNASEVEDDDGEDSESDRALRRTQQHAVVRAASRIALYMMRGESAEPSVEKVQESQHAHDFFVVNSCKVVSRLKEDALKDVPMETVSGIDPRGARVQCSLSQSLLPVTSKEVSQILDDIRKKSIFNGPQTSEETLLSSLQKLGHDLNLMKNIMSFALSRKEMGVSLNDLREEFRSARNKLKVLIEELISAQLLLRTGVTTVVMIHHKKVRPWLIHSRKLVRLDREKLLPTDGKAVQLEPGSEIDGENTTETEEIDDPDNEEIDDMEFVEVGESDMDVVLSDSLEESGDHSLSSSCQKVLELKNVRTKKGTSRLAESSSLALKEIDSIPSDQIRVVMRPWIRVDGSINRRVLDRLLGSILGHCLSNPGCSLEVVGERFSPALQPVHSRELCEVLLKLNCIQWKVLKFSHQTSLISKPRTIKMHDADGFESESDIILQPLADAILRLGIFIGDKAYGKDFLSSTK